MDYVSIADAETLQPARNLHNGSKLVTLIAAYINDVRLIDNVELSN
ncbi:MAG: pantoate--beta-alanine ligase [Segetibacter sp.]